MNNPILAIDAGNTFIHAGLVDTATLSCTKTLQCPTAEADRLGGLIDALLAAAPGILSIPCRISSVAGGKVESTLARIAADTRIESIDCVRVCNALALELDYQAPETLGPDRIAHALFAKEKFPGLDTLVVCVGTAVTADLVDRRGVFRGGAIYPGPQTQKRSLAQQTAALPEISVTGAVSYPGQSTESCIQAGIVLSVAGGAAMAYQQALLTTRTESLEVIGCGGGWKIIEKLLPFDYAYAPEATLVGTALFPG